MTLPPHFRLLLVAIGALIAAPGCTWVDSLRGNGFQSWNQSLGNGMRGGDPAATSSGYFTDRRSEEIEKSLGGGF
jgi:hypothetical protein